MSNNKNMYQIDQQKATQHYRRANNFHKEKKHYEAIKELQKAISYNPFVCEYHYNLGTTYLEVNENRKAYACYKICLSFLDEIIEITDLQSIPKKMLADDVIMLSNMGYVFEQFDDPNAKRCLEAAIRIDQNSFNARYNLGLYYFKRDLMEDAIVELTKAYTLNRHASDTIECLAYSYQDVGMIDESIDLIEGYKKDHPLTNGMLNILGVAYSYLDTTMNEAIKCFRKMTENEPKASFPHVLLAYAYAELGWKREAYSEIDIAKSLNKEEQDQDTEELMKDILEELDDSGDDNNPQMVLYLLMLLKKKMKEQKNVRE